MYFSSPYMKLIYHAHLGQTRNLTLWRLYALSTKPGMHYLGTAYYYPSYYLLGGAAVSSHCYQLGVNCSSTW